ncbi:TPA: ATP-dependent DNA helicase DinG [Vibrio parahaemolyticus]
MLNDVVLDIKSILENLGKILDGYAPRDQQRRMIFEISKSLVDENNGFVVVEAGTGVGKSLGYMISAIPTALRQGKKVVISTATIALQEQLINKDLPLFKSAFKTPFTYDLAKGRGNYVCRQSLFEIMEEVDALGGLEGLRKDSDLYIVKELFESLQDQSWNGERAAFYKNIPDKLWDRIKSDSHRCTKKEHTNCPFHEARDSLLSCDVIVANHALVVSDLSLSEGGGVILPEAAETIYVFDEGHHLPKIARDSVSGQYGISGTLDLTDSIIKSMTRYSKKALNDDLLKGIIPHTNEVHSLMDDLAQCIKEQAHFYQGNESLFEDKTYLVRNLSSVEEETFKTLKTLSSKSKKATSKISGICKKLIEDELLSSKEEIKDVNQIISDIAFYDGRLENIYNVANLFLNDDPEMLVAAWVMHDESKGFSVHGSPVDSAKTMKQLLWDHASDVVITSATLAALSSKPPFKLSIDLFRKESGLPEEAKFVPLGSPFDYPNVATLYVPTDNKIAPQKKDLFTKFLQNEMFRQHIKGQKSTLVLFSSYWQMREVKSVLSKIAEDNGYKLQCQGDAPKEKILDNHRQYVEDGIPSILMGTGSFSEGLDLPRDLLVNVIITKIPFGVPTDPVSVVFSESIQAKGGNPFYEIGLPDASRQLIQAVGRLIRTVEDTGRVIILDNRIATANYGSRLLNSLPPFQVVFGNPPREE